MVARKLIAFLWQKLKLLIADSALELIGSQDSVILTIDVGNRYCTRFTEQQFNQGIRIVLETLNEKVEIF